MIRDEFNKKKEENLSSKEVKKIRQLGERAYYVSSVNKIKQSIKLINFSAILGVVCCMYPLIQLLDIVIFVPQENAKALISFIVVSLVYVMALVWFIFINPYLKRKLKNYQDKLKELSLREVQKYKI